MCNLAPSFLVILLVIIITGTMGGLRNWMVEGDDGTKPQARTPWRFILDGVLASASIPLFLSVIGNERINTAFSDANFSDQNYLQSLFILIGFCSLASIFSNRFLNSLYTRVTQIDEKVEKVIESVEQAQIEPEVEDRSDEISNQKRETDLTPNERKTLRALTSGQFLMRSHTGLTTSTQMSRKDLSEALDNLVNKGLAKRSETSKGERWAPTDLGRQVTARSPTDKS